jgi:hypothetical protein
VTTPVNESLSSAPTPAAEGTGVWEDLIDIYYAPTKVFERRRDGRFWVPLLVLTAMTMVLYFATKPYLQPLYDVIFDKVIADMQAKNPNMNEEMLGNMRNQMDRFGWVNVLFIMPVMVVMLALTMWLVGKLFDSTQRFKQAMAVGALSQFPKLVESVLGGVQGYFMNPESITSQHSIKLSIARFMPETTSPVVLAILGRFDVFVIWCTILIAIGVMVHGNIPRARAAIVAVIVWLVATFPVVYSALKQGI